MPSMAYLKLVLSRIPDNQDFCCAILCQRDGKEYSCKVNSKYILFHVNVRCFHPF